MNSSLLTVEEVDGFPVGMICVVCCGSEKSIYQVGEIVKILGAPVRSLSRDKERRLREYTSYSQSVFRYKTKTSSREGRRFGIQINRMRPATPEEIAAL